MDIGQDTVTTASVTGDVSFEEPFPWARALTFWAECIAVGVLAAFAVGWLVR